MSKLEFQSLFLRQKKDAAKNFARTGNKIHQTVPLCDLTSVPGGLVDAVDKGDGGQHGQGHQQLKMNRVG